MSTAVTESIRVEVQPTYRPDKSDPSQGRHLFSYAVKIKNDGPVAVQLVSRHWYITDAHGDVEEVEGEGVVGQQPRLAPGEAFEYSSFCVLSTPHGSMHGTYRMVRPDGTAFDAAIAPFALVLPGTLN